MCDKSCKKEDCKKEDCLSKILIKKNELNKDLKKALDLVLKEADKIVLSVYEKE